MHLKFSLQGKQYAELDVSLAADGVGMGQFDGPTGPVLLEIAAGSGKRSMKTTQVRGNCQWIWTPQ